MGWLEPLGEAVREADARDLPHNICRCGADVWDGHPGYWTGSLQPTSVHRPFYTSPPVLYHPIRPIHLGPPILPPACTAPLTPFLTPNPTHLY